MKMKETYNIEWLNALPVNRKAKEMLIEVGEEASSSMMHSVQLAKWAIDRGIIDTDISVAETIEAMTSWRPVRLINFFMINPDGDYNPSGWDGVHTPDDFARVIIDEIEEKMMLHFPMYGSI